MQVAQVLGGYSLGGADLLRRAMGKKKPEEMGQHRAIFARGRGEEGHRRAEGRRDLRPDGEVRRLRLQQVARRRLRAARLPHGLDQGALPGRVHRRQHDGRARRHRQAEDLPRRCGARWASPSSRPTSTPAATASSRSADKRGALRPGRDQGHRAGRDRGDRRGARSEGGPVHAACSTSARRVDRSAHQQARGRGADQGRRLRRAARRPRRRCWPASALAFDCADTQAANADQGGLFDFARLARGAARRSRRWSPAEPWSIKERLTLEKAALGFYLSGHLFDQSADEVRQFAQAPHRRPDRQPRAAAAGRHRRRPARGQRPARPRGDLQARRQDRGDRGGGQRGAAQREPRAAQGRRADHRAGQGAARSLLRRPAPERARRCGTWPARAAASASTCASRSTAACRRWPRCCATSRRGAWPPSRAICRRA